MTVDIDAAVGLAREILSLGEATPAGSPRALAKALLAVVERCERLETALTEACDLAEEGWGYAGDYFCEKWDSERRLAECRAALPGDTERKGEVEG